MPTKAKQSQQEQVSQLRKAAAGQNALVVLDDMCKSCCIQMTMLAWQIFIHVACFRCKWICIAGDRTHEEPFDCVDSSTASKLLVTTR